jgi:hypothetical protein
MSTPTTYSIDIDVRFAGLELIDVTQIAQDCTKQWFNQTLCRVRRRLNVTPG